MGTLAHLADVRLPRLRKPWLSRWRTTAARVAEERPETILITGLAGSATQLDWFINEILPDSFGSTRVIHVPTFLDIARRARPGESFFTPRSSAFAGWQDPTETCHIYAIEHAGLLTEEELSHAAIPTACRTANHLHLFAHERNALPAALRPVPEGGQHVYAQLAQAGYDIVLNGHRDIRVRFGAYENIEASAEFTRGLWVLTPPSAVVAAWRGFNLIKSAADGSFLVFAFTLHNGAWHSQQLASRDLEAAGVRRWREQRQHAPTCEIIDVRIENYEGTTPEERVVHEQCGDILVTMALHRPTGLRNRLPLPLNRVVGYAGTDWRAVKAAFVMGEKRESLSVNDDNGTINVANHDGEDIEISAVLLNALPSQPGDWQRMRASQQGLHALFLFEPSIAARLLRLRIDWPQLRHRLRAVGSQPEGPPDFVAVREDDAHPGRYDVTIFRPLAHVSYPLTVEKGVDPVGDVEEEPEHVRHWKDLISGLVAHAAGMRYTDIRTAVDALRSQFVELAKQLRPEETGEDISVDLLAIDSQLHVVMSDSHTVGAVDDDAAPNLSGVSFEWGRGLAGRALRLRTERWWSKSKPQTHSSTWPPLNTYHRTNDTMEVHAHVYCRPILHIEEDHPYPLAIISFGTFHPQSALADIIKHLRQPSADEPVAVREVCEAAIANFTLALVAELKQAK